MWRRTGESVLAKDLTATEAPRPGERPDRRQVSWLAGLSSHRLPGVPQWQSGLGSPLTVAGAAADLGDSVPRSLFALISRDRRFGHLRGRAPPLSMSARAGANYRSAVPGAPACGGGEHRYSPRVVGSRMRRDVIGNAVRDFLDSAAAPATVSGEHPSASHWSDPPGRPRECVDPRARRPAAGINLEPRPRVEGAWGTK
jgi:hypothetical protein